MDEPEQYPDEPPLNPDHAAYVERVLREEIPRQLAEIEADPSQLMSLEETFARLRARRRARSVAAE